MTLVRRSYPDYLIEHYDRIRREVQEYGDFVGVSLADWCELLTAAEGVLDAEPNYIGPEMENARQRLGAAIDKVRLVE